MIHKKYIIYKNILFILGILLYIHPYSLNAVYFQSSIDINYFPFLYSSDPQLSINARGNAIGIWLEANQSSDKYNVYVRPYTNSSWGLASDLNTSTSQYSYDPQIAINSSEFAIAVWTEETSSAVRANVSARRYSSNTWVPAVGSQADVLNNNSIDSFTGGIPQVGVDENNNGIVVWQEYNHVTSSANIYSRRYISGAWVPVLGTVADNLNSVATNFAEVPQLSMNQAGQAMAVWIEEDKVYARYYDGSSWQATGTLTSNTSSVPQVALNANRKARAVWVESNQIYQCYFNGTSWGIASLLAGATSSAPQIAINGNDHATAVWVENSNVYASYYDGVQWNTENLNYLSSQAGSLPQVAMDDSNNAIIVWVEQNNIFARYFNGSIWSPAININNNVTHSATSPHVAANSKGNALTLWAEADSILYYKVIFSSAVLPIKLNQILAVNSAGNSLVVWQQTSDFYATNLSVQSSSPVVLTQSNIQKTKLHSGDSSGILMDAAGNAWTFVQNGNVLTKYTHFVGDPINQWTAEAITTTASEWTADVNLSGDVVTGYVDGDGSVYGSYNGSTMLLTSSACKVQAAISSGSNNVALAFQGYCLPLRGSPESSGDIAVVVYDSSSVSWVLSPTLASNSSNPQIQVDNNYNVVVIWQYNYDGIHSQIQAARGVLTRQSEWDWSTPIVDLTPDTNNAQASSPLLAVDGSGNALAVWEYTDDTIEKTVIQAAYYVFNQTWTDITTLSSTESSASNVAISMDNIGNAIVVWLIPYFNGTETVPRVQGTYFNTTTKKWQAIKITAAPVITTYISPEDKFATAVCTSLGANGLGIITYTLSDSAAPPNTLYGNIVEPAQGIIQDAQNLNQPTGTYRDVNCAFNSANLLGIVSNDINVIDNNTRISLAGDQAFSYGLVQWCSAFNGTKQYIAAVNANEPIIDWYIFDATVTPSLTYLQSLSLTNQTNAINDMAVYNKSDAELYLAIATYNNVQIKLWDGNSFVSKGTLDTTSSGMVTRVSWWVDTLNVDYVAYLATADINKKISIYGLDEDYVFHLTDSATVGSTSITSLLWYVKSDSSGEIELLDLVGGNTNSTIVYIINVGLQSKTINKVTANVRQYPMSGLSTCNTYLAIGDYGVQQSIGAAISLYDVTSTGSINQTRVVVPDPKVANIYYLAKCCAGSPQYLLAGAGNDTDYTLFAYKPDLSGLITKQQVGSLVDSVAWSPTGTNVFLGITYQDTQANRAGRLYKLDVTHVPPLIDLRLIAD